MKVVFVILLTCSALFAKGQFQEDVLPADRPGKTFNATTLHAGQWLMQINLEQGDYTKKSNYQGYANWAFPFDLRYGITDKIEIMASIKPNFAAQDGYYGGIEYSLMDYAGSLRYNIFKAKNYGSFSLGAGYRYISYEGGIANAKVGIAKLLYSLPLGQRLVLGTNLGYSHFNETGYDNSTNARGSFDYTAILMFNITQKFGLSLETYGSKSNISNLFFDGGFYWLPNNNVQVNMFFATGGNSNYQSYYGSIGICYRFGQER